MSGGDPRDLGPRDAGDRDRDAAELERLRAALYAPDAPPEAEERYRAALDRATPHPPAAPAPAAEGTAEPPSTEPAAPVERRPGHRLRTGFVAGALLLAAGIGAVLLVPRPATEAAARPLRIGAAIWSAHGVNGASSPTLDGRGRALLVRLRCRGDGQVLLAVDGRIRNLTCTAGKTLEDDQYFDGPHGEFLLSLSLVGHPTWAVSVHRVQVSG